jgi:hypothetical protein
MSLALHEGIFEEGIIEDIDCYGQYPRRDYG